LEEIRRVIEKDFLILWRKTDYVSRELRKKLSNADKIKMALHQKRREWFTGLWYNTNEIKLPFIFSNA